MKLKASNLLGQEQIDLLISRGLNLVWFPKELEVIYKDQYKNEAGQSNSVTVHQSFYSSIYI